VYRDVTGAGHAVLTLKGKSSMPTFVYQLQPFDYSVLLQDRLGLGTYTLLAFLMISLYWVKNNFIRGVIFFLALFMGLHANRIEWITIPCILGYGALYYYALHAKAPLWRGTLFIALVAISFAIMMHYGSYVGVHNWQVVSKLALSPDAAPYSMYFTFDKFLIGLFFLWFGIFTLVQGGKWKPCLKTGFWVGCTAILVLIPLSMHLGFVKFDLKFHELFFLWAINNLLFVCVAEEALFRGLIQKFLMLRFQNMPGGKWLALIITSLLFAAAHFPGGMRYMALVFVAGLFYGYAFIKTQKLEASILSHFMVNTVHFVAFTYPALKTAFPS
jgi:membrane protease YdiL (CAAX protease family)